VNLTSPHPVTNREFTTTLGRFLRRPTPFPVPAPLLWVALGEMAGDLLASQRAHPATLLDSGYAFRHPDLEQGIRHVLAPGPADRAPA
jgi:NAD dependent epimerase/dehydratase family enzyme